TIEAKVGESVKIPLHVTWRNEFTGTSIKLKAYGAGFEAVKEFDLPIKAASQEAVLDLAALKTPPGDYTLAFYGIGINKYGYNPKAVKLAEDALAAVTNSKALVADASNPAASPKTDALNAAKRMKAAKAAAEPKDTVDIFVSQPVHLSVKAAQVASAGVK
ncbi:MAG: hypothetical protein JWO94_872, partial [Verrucomicrobiaceae bacterium]|nr:hypothetical protein [Verrucomicrobiaceae bacterium]